jgi:hypothetical protein
VIAVGAIGVGLFLGWLGGGSVRALGSLRLRYEAVIVASFVIQGVARGRLLGTSASSAGLLIWIVTSILLMLCLLANARSPGVVMAITGVALNLIVVLANQGMPVVLATQLGVLRPSETSGGFYHLASQGTLGIWAADAIPLGLLGQHYYVSVGDVLLAAGVAVVVGSGMLADRQEPASS